MINTFSWKHNDKVFNLYKIINAPYHEIEKISSQFDIDIDTLMESYDLEQYPYIQYINKSILNTIVDLPILNEHVNIFSIPIHIILVENNILVICKLNSHELDSLEDIVVEEDNLNESFYAILNYISNLYLLKLRNIKKQLDKVMQEVYVKNEYNSLQEEQILKMSIELDHYMSSLETNNMVLKQIQALLKPSEFSVFNNMLLDSTQAYDISKLYLKLNKNLVDYFKLQQEKRVSKKINKLTTLTVSLTLPNIVFGFYGMNVNLPFANITLAWLFITLAVVFISIVIYRINKIDK